MNLRLYIGWLCLMLCSCEDQDLNDALGTYEPLLVIDGNIEQDKFAFVALTLSSGYLENINRDDLLNASELNAKVTLSDGERSEVLTLRRNEEVFPPFIYRSSDIKGELGKNYELKIEYNDEVFFSSTTIPSRKELDSIWFDTRVVDDTTRYILMATITDDAEEENFYRVFTKRIGIDNEFVPMYFSTVADNFFSGETINFTIFRGIQNLNETRDDGFFELGDSVQVRFSTIDRAHFDFWSTAEREIYSFSNPFSSSGNEILFNVDEKAIGVWGGYGSSYFNIKAE